MTVLKVDNAELRKRIEDFTRIYCVPHRIEFIQDAAGNWVTSVENMSNTAFQIAVEPLRERLKIMGYSVPDEAKNLSDLAQIFAEEIEHNPIVDDPES